MEDEIYTLAKFMDKNFTKPQKLRLTVQEYNEICYEVAEVLAEISNFDSHQTGLPDAYYRLMVLEVSQALSKYESQIRWRKINEGFEITLPVHICLFLLDILSMDNKDYSSEIRIPRGKLEGIISKNEFSAKFSSSEQIMQQFATVKVPQMEYSQPQRLSETPEMIKYYG